MGAFLSGLKKFWDWLCSEMPAIVISLFQYEEGRIAQKEREKDALKLTIERMENANAVEKKFANMSDNDIVLQSIRDGSDDSEPKSDSTGSGKTSGDKS